MPHRVATFFRSHTNSFDLPTEPKNSKKGVRRPSTSRPTLSSRAPSSSSSASSLQSADGASVQMPDNAHKRMSLTSALHSPKVSSTKVPQAQAATLDTVIESPPLVSYGLAANSSGALLSGRLKLKIHNDALPIEKIEMRLSIDVTRKKPFHAHCPECANQSTELKRWDFLQGPSTWKKGEHDFPFSYLLLGHLPASMKGQLLSIEYVLRATVIPRNGEPIKLTRNLTLKRAIHTTDEPRTSTRIFPPTNIAANCTLPHVIYPIGESLISMRVDGVVKRNVDTKMQTQWRLKRVTWRVDETQKSISPACEKHSAKHGEDSKKGIAHQAVRTIGTDDVKSGWKADYSTPDGSVEVEFPISIRADAKAICDTKAEDGTEVSHMLVVEMVVAEEFAPMKKLSQITPTGAARVLRMHFNMILTERSGLGISWDEEQPPLYQNVPPSPPGYGKSEPHEGGPIPDYEDLMPLETLQGMPRPNFSGEQVTSTTPSPATRPSTGVRLNLDDLSLEPQIPERPAPERQDSQ